MSKHDKKDWHKFKEEHKAQEVELNEEPQEQNQLNEELEQQEAALDHPSYVELGEKLTLAEQQAFEYREKLTRTLAESDNIRRRAEREVANAHRYGVEKLATALLPVVDSIEQALQMAAKEEDTAMSEGLELTMKLFVDVLQKFDVQPIDPIDAPFNPQEHEAMSIQDVPGTPPNTVITVFQKGYKLNDRVIRPARVVVSKNKPVNE